MRIDSEIEVIDIIRQKVKFNIVCIFDALRFYFMSFARSPIAGVAVFLSQLEIGKFNMREVVTMTVMQIITSIAKSPNAPPVSPNFGIRYVSDPHPAI